MHRWNCLFMLLFASCFLICSQGATASETTLSYQGVLVDSGGAVVADGEYAMRFSLWTLKAGGARVWGPEIHASVNVKRGAFAVDLGSTSPFSSTLFKTYANLWLEIAANAGSGMETYTPRVALSGSPWAARAKSAADADTFAGHAIGDFAAAAHAHSSLDAPDGAPAQALLLDREGNVAIKGNLDMGTSNGTIVNVDDPVNPQDVATKHYVDSTSGAPNRLVHPFTVALGQSVKAGDVVHLVSGAVRKGKAAATTMVHDSTACDIAAVALSPSQFVIVYRDEDAGGLGTAVLGTMSASSVTFSAAYVFNDAYTSSLSVSALSDTKFVVGYRDSSGGDCGTAIVGTVSGTSITFGPESVLSEGGTAEVAVAGLSGQQFVAEYSDGSTSHGMAVIGGVSDNAITLGDPTVFNGAGTYFISIAALSSAQWVTAYQDEGNSNRGTAVLGSVSGTSASFKSKRVFGAQDAVEYSVAVLNNTQFIIAYVDRANTFSGTVVKGAVSGATLSFGEECIFSKRQTSEPSATALSSSRFVIAYRPMDTQYGMTVLGEVSSSGVSFEPEGVFNNTGTQSVTAFTLSEGQCSIVYGPDAGTAAVTARFMDVELPLGIADASATAGQAVPVIISGISSHHSGLVPGKPYYENLGGLAAGASTIPVGWAVSPTELLLDIQRR